MTTLQKFNINNYATVTLTEIGAQIYNARYDDLKIPAEYISDKVEAGYVLKAQLWTLLQDFGQYMTLGSPNPFEQCIMQFDMKDFEE